MKKVGELFTCQKKAIYKVCCRDCDQTFVGQCSRRIKDRLVSHATILGAQKIVYIS